MATITEDYVSFEVAKLLKKKGFDAGSPAMLYKKHDNADGTSEIWTACTLQIVMKWLREVHNIIFVFKPASFSGENCTFWTYELWCGDNFEGEILSFKTYEEAVEAALKYSLKNLI